MSNIDLSDAKVEYLCHAFDQLKDLPGFTVVNDIDVQINFFKRIDSFFGIRTGSKADFESREEFIVYSFVVEDMPSRTKSNSPLVQLKIEDCAKTEIENIFAMGKKIDEYLPKLSTIKNSYFIENNDELNWAFLEEDTKYHSVFWSEAESGWFKRSA